MPEIRKKYDREFRDGAVRIVKETGKPIAQVARDLGVNEGTLGNWVARAREAREGTEGLTKGDIEELKRLRAENADLREAGWTVSEKTVADHMRRQGLVARRIKRRNGLVTPEQTAPKCPDL